MTRAVQSKKMQIFVLLLLLLFQKVDILFKQICCRRHITLCPHGRPWSTKHLTKAPNSMTLHIAPVMISSWAKRIMEKMMRKTVMFQWKLLLLLLKHINETQAT